MATATELQLWEMIDELSVRVDEQGLAICQLRRRVIALNMLLVASLALLGFARYMGWIVTASGG